EGRVSTQAVEGTSDVYVREFPANARGSGEEKILSKTTDGAQVYPVIAGNASGRIAAAWAGFGVGDDHGVFAALLGPEVQENRPPIIIEFDGDRSGREGDTFHFQVLADDPDSDDPLLYL